MVRKSELLMKLVIRHQARRMSTDIRLTNSEVTARRSILFDEEKKRQESFVTRMEKIQVHYKGVPEPCTLVMNKRISTPYDCAKHITEHIMSSSALAYVNGQPWDMHYPLTEDCELEFAHYKDPIEDRLKRVNKVFWRSCSFLLGYTIEHAFKEKHFIQLHSWPPPSIRSGSFVYDAVLDLTSWTPRPDELQMMGVHVGRLSLENKPFERLEVDASVAHKMFQHNKFKHAQVDDVAAQSVDGNTVVVYRCGDHVDMSRGPMVSSSSHIQSFTVTSAHPLETAVGLVYRFQGLAYPSAFTFSPYAFSVLRNRAETLNMTGLPQESNETLEQAEARLADEEAEYQQNAEQIGDQDIQEPGKERQQHAAH